MTDIDYSRYYSRWHDDSPEHAIRQGNHDYASLKEFLPSDRNAVIFDLGCGMGFALGGLRQVGYKSVSGIDSDRAQAVAAVKRGLSVDLVPVEQTISYLDSKKGAFDVVISLDVLEHIPPGAVLDVLRSVSNALKPGGLFVCRVPNCDSLIASRYRYNDWTHKTQFGNASLDFVLFNSGYSQIKILEDRDRISYRPVSFCLWLLRRFLRFWKRIQLISELGPKEALDIPLSPNIWGVAKNGCG